MHTTKIGSTVFIHDLDIDGGEVIIFRDIMNQVRIEGSDLLSFVTNYLKQKKTDTDDRLLQVVKILWAIIHGDNNGMVGMNDCIDENLGLSWDDEILKAYRIMKDLGIDTSPIEIKEP